MRENSLRIKQKISKNIKYWHVTLNTLTDHEVQSLEASGSIFQYFTYNFLTKDIIENWTQIKVNQKKEIIIIIVKIEIQQK